MRCQKCNEEMEWSETNKLYSCWKCYYQMKVNKDATLFD